MTKQAAAGGGSAGTTLAAAVLLCVACCTAAPAASRRYQPRGENILQALFRSHVTAFAHAYEAPHLASAAEAISSLKGEPLMKALRYTVLPIVLAAAWIAVSEFVRNQVLFPSWWVEHYQSLGIAFPSAPINGAMWGVWSLLYAIALFAVTRKFGRLQAIALSWLFGFVLMWVVIGNLGVLPCRLLLPAVPLSILEAALAVLIVNWTSPVKQGK